MSKYNTNSITRRAMLDLLILGGCSNESVSLCGQIISINAQINFSFGGRKTDPSLTEEDAQELSQIRSGLYMVELAIERDAAEYLRAIPAQTEEWVIAQTALADKLANHLRILTGFYNRIISQNLQSSQNL